MTGAAHCLCEASCPLLVAAWAVVKSRAEEQSAVWHGPRDGVGESSTLFQEHRLEQVRGVDEVGRGHPELAAGRSVVAVLGEYPGNQD